MRWTIDVHNLYLAASTRPFKTVSSDSDDITVMLAEGPVVNCVIGVFRREVNEFFGEDIRKDQ